MKTSRKTALDFSNQKHPQPKGQTCKDADLVLREVHIYKASGSKIYLQQKQAHNMKDFTMLSLVRARAHDSDGTSNQDLRILVLHTIHNSANGPS